MLHHRLLRWSLGPLRSKVSTALLVMFKSRSKEMDSVAMNSLVEMDSLATILSDIAATTEEWHQANRGRPGEDYRLVVVHRRRVMRRRRPTSFSRPGRFRLAEIDPADIEEALGQDEDPSKLRIFLALEGARTVQELRVRPFQVSRDISTTVIDELMELSNLRHNMDSYEACYPAAVEVRNNLGDEIWDGLEEYRCNVMYLAFSTLLQQTTDPHDFPLALMASLDRYIPHMEEYIFVRWGVGDQELFEVFHDTLLECIEEDLNEGLEIQEGMPMQFIRNWFRGQPIFWLAYNLQFPVEGRLSWEQVSAWAIQWLRRTNMEPLVWPIWLRGLYVWNPDTTSIWNGAVLEMFADIRRRFRLTPVYPS